jgi:DNA-binding response OmpR family regulator
MTFFTSNIASSSGVEAGGSDDAGTTWGGGEKERFEDGANGGDAASESAGGTGMAPVTVSVEMFGGGGGVAPTPGAAGGGGGGGGGGGVDSALLSDIGGTRISSEGRSSAVFGDVSARRDEVGSMALNHGRPKNRVNALVPHPTTGVEQGVKRTTVGPMRVLVVDDEIDLADAIARGLRLEGYAVDVAYSGEDAIDKVRLVPYDLVCLDVTMPGIDGIEVCNWVRTEAPHETPPRILMLTARDALDDRIAGLDAGADDYLVKPFAFAELTARSRSLLRRDAGSSGAVLEVGGLRLDTSRQTVSRDGEPVELTTKEFALLRYFMVNPGRVISQEDLLEHVWDENTDPFTNTVRVTVGTLRRKLTPEGATAPIETVIGAGYRLVDGS